MFPAGDGFSLTGFPSYLYRGARAWIDEDARRVEAALGSRADVFRGKRILLTGAAGFLGFNFLHFFSYLNSRPDSVPVKVVAADSFLRGLPRWIVELTAADPHIELRRFDVTERWPMEDEPYAYVLHGASIASPMYYRRYPLQTLDANITGLRNMLDLARRTSCESVLFFSSSEIYGDPPADQIPTNEDYRGNVACIGPRACYDESKRLGETLCYLYAQQYQIAVKMVRPFNNYGPGLRLSDGRVLPDLCRDALADRDIVLYSDGSPTRTFCYAADAITGYLLVLLSLHNGEAFNVGAEAPEISMSDLASLVLRLAGSSRRVVHQMSPERDYLTDNPRRRCPDIGKARALVGFEPRVELQDGVARALHWYRNYIDLEAMIDQREIEGIPS